jgi:hypothetical protein
MKRPALPSPPWRPIADAVVGELLRFAFRRELPFPEDLGGACATGSVAMHAALAAVGVSAVFVGGKMLRPRVVEPHTWLEAGDLVIDATASQAGLSSYTARIVAIDSPAYGARTGRHDWYCAEPHDRKPGGVTGPWEHQHTIVKIVAAALERPSADVAPFVERALWGSEEERDAVTHPLALAAAARVCGPELRPEDIRGAAKLLRVLARGGEVKGWRALRDRVLGGP